MTRTSIFLATFLALGLAPGAVLAQSQDDAGQTGSIEPPLVDAVDQPTPGEVRRLRREMAEGDEAEDGLPPPEAISPEIDLMVPAPDDLQEP